MNKLILTLFLSWVLAACTTLESLDKVKPASYFILEEHHIREQSRGLVKTLWVEALLKGKYVEYAKDNNGTFYLGETPSVVVLMGNNANKFIETKKISPGPFLQGSLIGGLWIPNNESNKKLRLFYTMKHPNTGVVRLGLVEDSITAILEGSLQFIPYGSESEFIENIQIKDLY